MPVTMRHGTDQPLPSWRAAAGAGHVRRCPSLVEEDEAVGIEQWLPRRPGQARFDYVIALLLFGLEVLFLSVRPSRATTFHSTG